MNKTEYIKRRKEITQQLEDQSFALFAAGQAKHKSLDANFKYFPERNFYYLTGLTREKFILLLVKNKKANLDFISGRVDLLAADAFVLFDFLESKDGQFAEAVGPDFDDKKYLGEGIGIGIRKQDQELKEKLNKAIAQIRADGTYKKINDKYFAFDVYGSE